MKYTFLFLILFATAYCARSRPGKISFEYKRRIELRLSSTERITSAFFDNKFYYSSKNWDKRNGNGTGDSLALTIYSYDHKRDLHDSFKLSIPGSGAASNYQISSFSINDRYIALMVDKVYLFDIKSKKFITSYGTAKARDIQLFNNDELLLTENYNFHPLDDSVKTKMIVYDAASGIEKHRITPHFDLPILTNLICKNINVSNGLLAFARSVSYDITFYDLSTLRISSVIKGDTIVNDDQQLSRLRSLQDKMYISNDVTNTIVAAADIDDNISRIQYIEFLADNIILVLKRLPGNNTSRSIDVWELRNGTWIQLVKDQLYEMNRAKEDLIATEENSPVYFIYSNIFHANAETAMIVTDFVPVELGMKHSDFSKYQDTYFTDHEPRYQLLIYDWHLEGL